MPLESTARFDEKASLAPNSPYSASKAAADLLVLSYARTYGLPVSISRSSNNYGAFQHAEKLIPKSILCAIHGERIPLYGDGKNQRSWIYVLDHCRAVDLILEEGRAGEIYNVASKVELSNIELIQRLLALLDAPRDGFVFVEDRRGHDRSYPIDTTKIERELGFFPTTLWEDGIRQTIAHYLNKYKK